MRKNVPLGVIIGLVGGLFVNSLILTLGNEWLAVFILPILIPPILGVVLGVYLMNLLPPLPTRIIVLALFTVLISGFFLIRAPRNTVELHLRSVWDQLPVYPNAEFQQDAAMVVTGCSDNPAPWMSGTYILRDTEPLQVEQVAAFYREEFARRGWKRRDYQLTIENFYNVHEAAEVTVDIIHGGDVAYVGMDPPSWHPNAIAINVTLHVHRFCGTELQS